MVKITKEEWEKIPDSYKGVWETERWDIPNWESLRKTHIGKRTLLRNENGESVLWVEGISFEIV